MGEQQSTPTWRDENLTVLIPMNRFEEVDSNKPDTLFQNH